MVLRVEKKLFVIKQPISPASPTDSKYLRSGMRFMMLIMRLLVLCSEEEGKPVGPYVIKIKNYVAQLERLGYVLPQDLSVGLILNGLTSDFAGFAATPQVMAIQGGRIYKFNKKSLNAKGKGKGKGKGKDKSYIPKPKNPKPSAKEHPAKDDTCYHCKEVGHCKRNYPTCLVELIKKKKQVGTANYALESAARILNMVPIKKVDKTPYELWYGKVPNLSYLKVWGCEALVKRDTPNRLQQRSFKCIFVGYPKETMGYYFYFPPENKIVVARYAEFLEKTHISQEVSGRAGELKEIQDEDTSPSKNTSEIPMEVEGFEPPHEEEVSVHRPDVAFAQNITSRFQQNPGELHWTTVKTILKYLRNTKDMFLVYGGNPEAELRVDCYCDAGFETVRDDTKSQTGYVFILNGGAVDWKSSKQSTIAMSATEAEYIAASEAGMEAVWIRKFISGLGILPTINEPIKMFCDNSAALYFANEPGVQKGARHYHRSNLLKVHTDDNLAYPFTKALPKGKLTQHAKSMRFRLASSFM
ncbi:retrotransposon protein, putative, ty1-copia subclass [Tanacetum coccineum]